MSAYRPRETKRGRLKLSKNIARIYRASKCRDCSVVITPMDFAKILGKFTKVKIQYESSNSPKSKPNGTHGVASPNSNARLKSNENGMVLIHRNAYSQHPVKELYSPKKQKVSKALNNSTTRQTSNILKENNRQKKTHQIKERNSNNFNEKKQVTDYSKQYGIIFTDPQSMYKETTNEASLSELLPVIDETILPSEEWDIDYFPKDEEPKEDKVYDRIAAELEDLMYNDSKASEKPVPVESKVDEFPSIMDILNATPSDKVDSKLNEKNNDLAEKFKTNLESSDVEAMLLGESSAGDVLDSIPMDTDQNNDIKSGEASSNLIKDEKILKENVLNDDPSEMEAVLKEDEEKCLPSEVNIASSTDSEITDTTKIDTKDSTYSEHKATLSDITKENIKDTTNEKSFASKFSNISKISHIVFKQMKNGNCFRSVMCPKSLKYSIEFEGKSAELLGAPKYISNLEDLKVLLQIVNDSGLASCYVFC